MNDLMIINSSPIFWTQTELKISQLSNLQYHRYILSFSDVTVTNFAIVCDFFRFKGGGETNAEDELWTDPLSSAESVEKSLARETDLDLDVYLNFKT